MREMGIGLSDNPPPQELIAKVADAIEEASWAGGRVKTDLAEFSKKALSNAITRVFHDLAELEAMGVRRLSVGSGPVRHILEQTIRMADKLHAGDVSPILGWSFNYAMANKYFGD